MADKFAALTEQYTEGRVKVQVFHGGTLFAGAEQWAGLVTGSVDILAIPPFYSAPTVPEHNLFTLSGFWESPEHAQAFAQNPAGGWKLITTYVDKYGLTGLGVLPGQFKSAFVSRSTPINSRYDQKGLKRPGSLPTESQLADIELGGAIIISMPYADYVPALAQGVVDIRYDVADTIVVQKAYEQAKYGFGASNYDGVTLYLANKNSWAKVSAVDQDIILKQVMPVLIKFAWYENRKIEDAAFATLANYFGAKWVVETAAQRAEFYAAVAAHPAQIAFLAKMPADIVAVAKAMRFEKPDFLK